MSQATRCPRCGTVFRVVRDQLRVSEGWVRCGRCTEIFNAAEHPVDLEAEAMAVARRLRANTSAPTSPAEAMAAGEAFASASPAREPPTRAATDDDGADVELQWPEKSPQLPATPQDIQVEPPAPLPEIATAPSMTREPAPVAPSATVYEVPADEPLDLRAEDQAPPAFVRKADAAARWRRPAVRGALVTLATLGAALLALQAVFEYRDLVAARWPQARGVLELACERMGCRLEAPRLIDALAVEGSGLLRIEGSKVYRLSVVLKNRAPMAVAVPAIELVLTDAQGRLVTRRVLRDSELGLRLDALPAGSEWPLQALLEIDAPSVSGYTIELFHP